MVITVTKDTFEQEVLKSELPVLVDFYADWCGPCQMMGPVVEDLSDKYEGSWKVCRVNVDENQELATQYRIMSIPCFITFKGGIKIKQIVGGMEAGEFEQKIMG